MNRNVKTDCVLESEPFELNHLTPITNYAEVWWDNKKGKILMNTGLHVHIKNREHVQALQRHPYKLKPMDYSEMLVNIQENGVHRIQLITAVEEPRELTYNDLLTILNSMKEIERGLPVRLKDIITEKEYFFQGVQKGNITDAIFHLKIMEVQR